MVGSRAAIRGALKEKARRKAGLSQAILGRKTANAGVMTPYLATGTTFAIMPSYGFVTSFASEDIISPSLVA